VATSKSSKTSKRKARQSDQAHAAELARRYWERDPYRVKIDGRIVERHVDGDQLAYSLETFAERGTFELPAKLPIAERRLILRDNFNRLRERTGSAGKALDIIIDVWGLGEQTVRDDVYGRKPRKT